MGVRINMDSMFTRVFLILLLGYLLAYGFGALGINKGASIVLGLLVSSVVGGLVLRDRTPGISEKELLEGLTASAVISAFLFFAGSLNIKDAFVTGLIKAAETAAQAAAVASTGGVGAGFLAALASFAMIFGTVATYGFVIPSAIAVVGRKR